MPIPEEDFIDRNIPEQPHYFVGGANQIFCQSCGIPRSDLRYHRSEAARDANRSGSSARLQLRWASPMGEPDEYGYREWICHYELLLPLDEHDIRREDENCKKVRDFLQIELGTTKRNTIGTPCHLEDGRLYYDPPYRDAAHAKWDSSKLGGLPVVCVAPDGTVINQPPKDRRHD